MRCAAMIAHARFPICWKVHSVYDVFSETLESEKVSIATCDLESHSKSLTRKRAVRGTVTETVPGI